MGVSGCSGGGISCVRCAPRPCRRSSWASRRGLDVGRCAPFVVGRFPRKRGKVCAGATMGHPLRVGNHEGCPYPYRVPLLLRKEGRDEMMTIYLRRGNS